MNYYITLPNATVVDLCLIKSVDFNYGDNNLEGVFGFTYTLKNGASVSVDIGSKHDVHTPLYESTKLFYEQFKKKVDDYNSIPVHMDIKEFKERGYLQEVNRKFLHPLGLALEVVIDDGSYT